MQIIDWIDQHWGLAPHYQFRIIYSILTIVVLRILLYLVMQVIFKTTDNVKERYYWKNAVKYSAFILGFVIISGIWINEFKSVATFLGLVSAGLAISLRDPIVNLVAWIFIIIRKPFEVGDRIQVGNSAGDVIDIRIFQFTLNEIGNWVEADQSTGRIIHIPNGKVFTEPQANFTQGFSHLWNEIAVILTFESNWEKAKEILLEIVNKHAADLTDSAKRKLIEASKKFMIFYRTLSPMIYTSVKNNGIQLTMRYLCEPKKRRITNHLIWEDILREFINHKDIQFAYPTQRIYFSEDEGNHLNVKTTK